ncbi:hypothetical protein [Flavobacterium sp. K5-23]|uniref:hypothetical protein n=1 Tax=Flavobacterium sp. K5-23 TaxID=2746225 RepID=UPI00200EFB34|nr:hypothetical protein [Flavobacterium sp. K5-23]UQD57154.1 hypothetical protein FLAK523_12450 [Flavobacterium sp. K5-23]
MEDQKISVPKWYWAAAIFFLLWNLMGVGSFFQFTFITDEALQALPAAERSLYTSYPLWTKIAFAIAVFGGVMGTFGLILKKKWAKSAFIISLCAIIPQMTFDLFFTKSREVYGPGTEIMPILIIVIGVFLVWFSGFGIKKNWLK